MPKVLVIVVVLALGYIAGAKYPGLLAKVGL